MNEEKNILRKLNPKFSGGYLLDWKSTLFIILMQLHLDWWQHHNLKLKLRLKIEQYGNRDRGIEREKAIYFFLPDSMVRTQCGLMDGMVNAGIVM